MDKAQIIAIIADQLGISEAEITEETSFADLGADSLDVVELLMTLEDEFGISVSDEEALGLKTVADIEKLINDKK